MQDVAKTNKGIESRSIERAGNEKEALSARVSERDQLNGNSNVPQATELNA